MSPGRLSWLAVAMLVAQLCAGCARTTRAHEPGAGAPSSGDPRAGGGAMGGAGAPGSSQPKERGATGEGGTPAGDGGASASGSDGGDPPSIDGLPEPATEITVRPGAALPSGLWVGELHSPTAMASIPDPARVCGATSHRITLEIRPGSGGRPPQGTVVLGEQQVAGPQPTDPEAGYPPGFGSVCGTRTLSAGYPYSLREGVVSVEGAFDFRVVVSELWDSWCSQQQSVAHPGAALETGYLCLPAMDRRTYQRCRDVDAPDRTVAMCPASVNVFLLCDDGSACYCLEDGCRARPTRTIRFELVIAGELMTGVLATQGAELPPIEVKLRRVR